jgi:V-type H+-transporting ATPase subunit E
MTDTEVERQIQQMKSFIEREAKEKVDEINAKAEEEFNIEKARLVQQEKLKIMSFYERKEKQVELQRKIQRSNLLNQSRLAILKSRDEQLSGLLEETRSRLSKIRDDPVKYKPLLQSLITQGLCQMLDPEVVLVCRKEDVPAVKSVIAASVKDYKSIAHKDCTVTVSADNYLPDDCAGGVNLMVPSGKIRVRNTLESRLELLSAQMLPEIRTILFGPNLNRKFDN